MLRTDLKQDICPGITQYMRSSTSGATLAKRLPQRATRSGSFLFIPDLTNKATGAVLVVLIILYVGTQVASTLMMSVTADKTQRRIFLLLPFVFVTFIISFPAGLIVYWITTNTWTIAQQYIVRRTVGPIRPPLPAAAGAGAGGGRWLRRRVASWQACSAAASRRRLRPSGRARRQAKAAEPAKVGEPRRRGQRAR